MLHRLNKLANFFKFLHHNYLKTLLSTALTKTVSVRFEFKVGSFDWSDDLNNNSSAKFLSYQSQLCTGPVSVFMNKNIIKK